MAVKGIYQFPPGFLWGCATAAHQVEGQNTNNWSRWEATPGHIFGNHTAQHACEWWSGRFEGDFDLAADMHNNAQRISIEWSRLEPEPGTWDTHALDRYRQMVRGLTLRGMMPMLTLHHFTLPLWADDRGAWLWDDLPEHFARFAGKVAAALGDLCTLWCTLNEPTVVSTNGYLLGAWTPGQKSMAAAARANVNMLRAHAMAYRAIKAAQPQAQVGLAGHRIGIRAQAPAFINRIPMRVMDHYFNNAFMLALRDGEAHFTGGKRVRLPEVKNTLDWVGLQYYFEYKAYFSPRSPGTLFITYGKSPAMHAVTPPKWGDLNPDGTFEHIRWLSRELRVPIYVTEAGVPDPDDTLRPGYLAEAVRAVWKAVNYNYPVRGFFFWSLLDNFEWAEGYDPRYNFGLYKVDFESQSRTARPSAHLYGEICAKNGLAADSVAKYAPSVLPRLFPGEVVQEQVRLRPR